MNKLVLFDIDGTILLTAGAGRRAIVAALTEEVAGTDAFSRVRFDGKTDPQIVAELLEAAGDRAPLEAARLDALCQRLRAAPRARAGGADHPDDPDAGRRATARPPGG